MQTRFTATDRPTAFLRTDLLPSGFISRRFAETLCLTRCFLLEKCRWALTAEIKLFNGKELAIRVNRENKKQIYVERAELNGKPVGNYKIPMSDIMQGGVLEFFMK